MKEKLWRGKNNAIFLRFPSTGHVVITTALFAVVECKKPVISGEGKLEPDQASYGDGEKVELKCSKGHVAVGVTVATCQQGGFTEAELTCVEDKTREWQLRFYRGTNSQIINDIS